MASNSLIEDLVANATAGLDTTSKASVSVSSGTAAASKSESGK